MSVKRLGRGLGALIRPEKEQKIGLKKSVSKSLNDFSEILLNNIKPNPNQPRRLFNDKKLIELADSIKEKGVLTPITVREKETGYELVAGERRWRASQKAGMKSIPAYIIQVKDDSEMMEMALIENIQRENLNPLEESEAYAVLTSKFDMSHDAIAKSVGKNRATISNSLRLLQLPVDIRKSLRVGEISAGHARAILQAKTTKSMHTIWAQVISQNLSVRATELLSKGNSTIAKKEKLQKNIETKFTLGLENQLIEFLGTKVKIKPGKKGGFIQLSYYSNKDLNRIIEIINKNS